MPFEANSLPANVLAALERGGTLEAIKLLRESTGLGLKEAKDVIDAHLHGRPLAHTAVTASGSLPAPVVAALQQGRKLDAIRLLREHTGMGLKESKDAVDAFERRTGRAGDGLGLGEVRRRGNGAWLLVLAIVALAGYYLLRSAA